MVANTTVFKVLKTGKGGCALVVFCTASTSYPLLDNIGKASAFHTKRRKTKKEERKVADRGERKKIYAIRLPVTQREEKLRK